MTKTSLLALALVASLSLPSLAQAGGLVEITVAPRVESASANLSSVDIGSIFQNSDEKPPISSPITIPMDKGDIGLSLPANTSVGTLKVGSGKVQTTESASASEQKFVVSFDCAVAGTPSEFPDDLRITNAGPTTVPTGTRIKWQTKAPRLTGAAVLSAPLKAGKTVSLNGAIAGGVEAGTACSAKAIGL